MSTLIRTALFVATFAAAATSAGDVRMITDWNETVLAVAEAEDGFLTLKGVRATAMMHLAMHDALTKADPDYGAYASRSARPAPDPTLAAVAAAYGVALDQYPGQAPRFTALRDRWFAVAGGSSPGASIQVGKSAAAAVLGRRADDGWNTEASYQWHPMAPGVYAEFQEHSGTPNGFVFGAGWANARPFSLRRPGEFRSPPPPAIHSDAYTAAYNEVKEAGRDHSEVRTPDQTHLALWWKDFAENSHNRLARDLARVEGLEAVTANRLFALLNVAIFDAYVSVFDNKFFYNHWRPYTAIRWADHDGNPETLPDPDWNNTHGHTYAFPSYPSAHGTACAAAMAVIADVFGADYAFVMRTPQVDAAGPLSGKMDMDPVTRRFRSPSDAAMECAVSRVYLGIHFRYDSTQGYALGARIGQRVLQSHLRPVAGPTR